MDIITRIVDLIDESGYKQNKEFEKACGLPNGITLKWKEGKSKPSLDSIMKLVKHFTVSADYLLGLSDIKHPVQDEGGKLNILSEQEEDLIEGFRKLKQRTKHDIMGIVYDEVDKTERAGDGRKKA